MATSTPWSCPTATTRSSRAGKAANTIGAGACPSTTRNWLGTSHLDYLDLAGWVRENPGVELPYWICAPAYYAFPDHTLGDFGFKPWQEFITAMQQTRRAFAAVWMSNGPGLVWGVWQDMVPQIRLHQSLPAFSNCFLDTRAMTERPKGSYRPGKYDDDFQKHADKLGGINLYGAGTRRASWTSRGPGRSRSGWPAPTRKAASARRPSPPPWT